MERTEAISEYREAIRIKKDHPEAHGALGQAFLQQGRFAEARVSTLRYLDLLPPGHRVRPFVSQQLQKCERLLALEQKLPGILEGKVRPASAAESLAFAELCQEFRRQNAAAVHFYAEAFAEQSRLAGALENGHRYTTSSRHRPSRSSSCGNLPCSALRQKLSKALSATSSSSRAPIPLPAKPHETDKFSR
jgi:hypothetical protein